MLSTAIAKRINLLLCWFLPWLRICGASIPVPPQFFTQLVNHVDNDDNDKYYTQRYYTYNEHFGGPGSPIFLILGGEGAIEPSRGIFYDIVAQHWAATMGAAVVQPEHRFYGTSQPVSREEIQRARDAGLPDPRVTLLTTEQALYDAVRLTQHLQQAWGCAMDKASPSYCPVVAFGGSYPGFMAATIRLRFPDVIDIAYAASAPIRFYSQQTPQAAYYQHITNVTEQAYAGCTAAVQDALTRAVAALPSAVEWGLCPATVPPYAAESPTVLAQEVVMMVAILFANSNMGYYPPSKDTRLVQVCQHFVSSRKQNPEDPVQTVREVLINFLAADGASCLDMTTQLPTGPHATVSAGDWSGVGTGPGGESWDFQTCTLLVEAIGFDAEQSMFPNRRWSLAWLRQHCQERFSVIPQPHKLVQAWRFDEQGIKEQNASYIIFTNGLHDGWSVSGVVQNLTDTVVAVNFPTGAHHSDLSAPIDPALNTDDINIGRSAIGDLLQDWLHDIRQAYQQQETLTISSSQFLRAQN